MIYSLTIKSNNYTYREGDTLLLSINKSFNNIESIDSILFDFTPLDTAHNRHDIDVRWSYNVNDENLVNGRPHIVWSSWEPLVSSKKIIDPFSVFSKIIQKNNSVKLQFRIIRIGNDLIARRVDRIVLNILHSESQETVINALGSDTDECKATSCISPNFSSGVTLKCDNDSLFSPYAAMGPGVQLWKDLSSAVGEMFGHCVRYLKTKPKSESADAVLKEYSLYNVIDVKDIKILIPDNTIPDNVINFTSFDMDFSDSLEIHIVKEHFERAFGAVSPQEKDYLYFPLMDRLYEVHSAYLFKDFMGAEAYYKVMLYKWQDKLNVMRENESIAEYVEAITENFEDILQPEIEKEYVDVTKPLQYTTVSIGGQDKIRSHINENLNIEVKDVNNYFTVVGKYYYDLKKNMHHGDLAVNYKLKPNRELTDNTAFSFWINLQNESPKKNPPDFDIILEAYSDSNKKGYRFVINYENVNANSIPKSITLQLNDGSYEFQIPHIQRNKWYGIVINHLNSYSQISLHIWEMKYNQSQPTINKTTDLKLIYSETQQITSQSIKSDVNYQLRAGNLFLTNLRIWNQTIEEEKQPKILNQYIVRESHLADLIDNAVSPLRLIREYVR